jgi:hypothetical protein
MAIEPYFSICENMTRREQMSRWIGGGHVKSRFDTSASRLDIHKYLGASTTRLRMMSHESITYITKLVICRVSACWALKKQVKI